MKSTVIVVSSLLLLLSAFVNECQGFGGLFPPAARGKRKGPQTKMDVRNARNICAAARSLDCSRGLEDWNESEEKVTKMSAK